MWLCDTVTWDWPELNRLEPLLSDPHEGYDDAYCQRAKSDVENYIQIFSNSLTFSRFLKFICIKYVTDK